jgi:hypothetical protein
MSEGTTVRTGDGSEEERQVERLLRAAGARAGGPPEELEALRAAALGAWRSRYGGYRRPDGERRLRWTPWLAAAALLLVAVAAVLLRPDRVRRSGTVVATVERIDGPARLLDSEGADVLAPRAAVISGATIETPAADGDTTAGLALRTAAGASLRVDGGTRLRFPGASLVVLERGAVYVDSGGASGEAAIAVETAAGLFRDVGTQFEVRILPTVPGSGAADATRLRVREGSVRFASANGTGSRALARAGEELAIAGDGSVRRKAVPSYGDAWRWVVATAPALEIEGATARRYLDWVARETGLALAFADARAEEIAEKAIVHGSIDGIPVADTPAVVLPSCGLAHEVADGRLVISVRTSS